MKARTTLELSKALQQIQDEAIIRIKEFFTFNKDKFDEIEFTKDQGLTIEAAYKRVSVIKITEDCIVTAIFPNNEMQTFNINNLSADALLTILDELERMKKNNQLKK